MEDWRLWVVVGAVILTGFGIDKYVELRKAEMLVECSKARTPQECTDMLDRPTVSMHIESKPRDTK